MPFSEETSTFDSPLLECEFSTDDCVLPRAELVRPSTTSSFSDSAIDRQRETQSFNVYIDESGDEGFGRVSGTSDWFVLSAAVVRAERDCVAEHLIREIKETLETRRNRVLHCKKLKHEERVYVCNRLATEPLRCVSVVIDKRSIREPETFRDSSRLYFYGVRMLLERVSWLCRDFHDPTSPGNGRAKISFSKRTTMSYENLRQYLIKLRDEHTTSIAWDHLDINLIDALTAGRRPGLQIADIFASAAFKAVQPNDFGLTEPRYLRELRPLLYRRRGILLGNGLKLWPGELNSRTFPWLGSL